MKSLEITNATLATAQAIAKTTDTIEYNQTLSANANLRISNLEKSLQKSNTIINQIKSKNLQKNFQGSHFSESVAAPEKMTLSKKVIRTNMKRNMVDLTAEDIEENDAEEIIPSLPTPRKKQKLYRAKNPCTPTLRKSVQWKEREVKDFHPSYPAAEMFSKNTTPNPFMLNSLGQRPHLFPTPPPPSPYMFHMQNPFGNYQTHFNIPNQFLHQNQTQPYLNTLHPFNHLTNTQTKATKANPLLNQHYHHKN
jgi:hypothetical protein